MQRTRLAFALPLFCWNAAGCRDTVDVPDDRPPPVIEALLLADSNQSTFRIVWPTWGDDPGGDTPVGTDSVDLTLEGPDGRASLVPDPGTAGLFRAALRIERGKRYRLAGTVADRRILAETTMPTRFLVGWPADTVLLPTRPPASLPFRWTSEGATAYFARGARLDILSSAQAASRDTSGLVYFDPQPGASSLGYTLFAVNLDADRYLFSFPAGRSNVEGGFGYLGGAIALERVVRW
ncbi:MAG: hypothetical protein R2909_23770 [Gemmatimonadales bacterium]